MNEKVAGIPSNNVEIGLSKLDKEQLKELDVYLNDELTHYLFIEKESQDFWRGYRNGLGCIYSKIQNMLHVMEAPSPASSPDQLGLQ